MDWQLPIVQLKRAGQQQQQQLLVVEPKVSWRLGLLQLIAAVAAVLAVAVELAAAVVALAAVALAEEGGDIQIQPLEASAPQTGVVPLMPLAADILEARHIAAVAAAVVV